MKHKVQTAGFKQLVENELAGISKTHRALANEIGESDATLSNWLNGLVDIFNTKGGTVRSKKDVIIEGLNRLKKQRHENI